MCQVTANSISFTLRQIPKIVYCTISQVLLRQTIADECRPQFKFEMFTTSQVLHFFQFLEHEEQEMENLKTACNKWHTFSMRVNFPNSNSVKLFPWGWIFLSRTMWISTCQILTRTLLTSPKLNESRQYHHIEWFFFSPWLVNVCFI